MGVLVKSIEEATALLFEIRLCEDGGYIAHRASNPSFALKAETIEEASAKAVRALAFYKETRK